MATSRAAERRAAALMEQGGIRSFRVHLVKELMDGRTRAWMLRFENRPMAERWLRDLDTFTDGMTMIAKVSPSTDRPDIGTDGLLVWR